MSQGKRSMPERERVGAVGVLLLGCVLLGALDAATRVVIGAPTVLLEHHAADGATTQFLQQDGAECRHHEDCLRQFLCIDEVCSHCNSTEACEDRRAGSVCQLPHGVEGGDGVVAGTCHHKDLFSPFEWTDFMQIFVTFATIMFAAPVGIGGGGILVPMYMFLGGFSAHAAIPLSKATILGGALANNLMNMQRRHPFANRPLLDYDALQLIVPNLLAGTILGVFVLATTPAWIIVFSIVVTLGYNAYTTFQKTQKLYTQEVVEPAESKGEEKSLLGGEQGEDKHWSFKEVQDAEVNQIIKAESGHDLWAWGLFALAEGIVLSCAVIKGGVQDEQWLECGGLWYFLVALIPLPIMVAITWHIGTRVNARYEAKLRAGISLQAGEAEWTLSSVRLYSSLAILAGVGAGCLGIAAGLLVGPMLLQVGIDPVVSVACTGCMILFSASSTSVQYLLLGQLKLDYALFYALFGFAAGISGNTALHWAVARYKSKWFVLGLLFVLLIVSTSLLVYLGVEDLSTAVASGNVFAIRDFCHDRPT